MSSLMLIFGAGYLAVFTVFLLLYLHAYRTRRQGVNGTVMGKRRRKFERAAVQKQSPRPSFR